MVLFWNYHLLLVLLKKIIIFRHGNLYFVTNSCLWNCWAIPKIVIFLFHICDIFYCISLSIFVMNLFMNSIRKPQNEIFYKCKVNFVLGNSFFSYHQIWLLSFAIPKLVSIFRLTSVFPYLSLIWIHTYPIQEKYLIVEIKCIYWLKQLAMCILV